jgi:hypothetical protein
MQAVCADHCMSSVLWVNHDIDSQFADCVMPYSNCRFDAGCEFDSSQRKLWFGRHQSVILRQRTRMGWLSYLWSKKEITERKEEGKKEGKQCP